MDIEIRPLRDDERADGGGVAGRALATSHTSQWVWGDDKAACLQGNLDLFIGLVSIADKPIGALLGTHVVGICAASPPGACFCATAPPELRAFPEAIGEVGDPSRVQHVWATFCAHDLEERHWHLGPVGVEPSLQGSGVGGLMLAAFGAQMDDAGEVAWLETDKPDNVVFYRRAGFEVTEETHEHGLTSYWMRRDPR